MSKEDTYFFIIFIAVSLYAIVGTFTRASLHSRLDVIEIQTQKVSYNGCEELREKLGLAIDTTLMTRPEGG